MNKRNIILLSSIILMLLISGLVSIQSTNTNTVNNPIISNGDISSLNVSFESSPILTWYNNTPYQYVVSLSAPANWSLSTNAPLRMSDGMTANDTASQTIFGIVTTGSYYVDITIYYHTSSGTNGTNEQFYTLNVDNSPYIYSNPETFFFPDSMYNYTYEINQGSISDYSPNMNLNESSHTISEKLGNNTSYNFFLTVSDSNGKYTQAWSVSSNNINRQNFVAEIDQGSVNITSPVCAIGYNNTTVFLNNEPVFYSSNLTHSYTLKIINSTAYCIETDSTTSQPVTLYFSGLEPGTVKYIYLLSGSNNKTVNLVKTTYVPYNGVISVIYNPQVMPLDPVFRVTNTIINPTQVILKRSFNYTEFIILSTGVLFVAIIFYFYGKSKNSGGNYGGGRRI